MRCSCFAKYRQPLQIGNALLEDARQQSGCAYAFSATKAADAGKPLWRDWMSKSVLTVSLFQIRFEMHGKSSGPFL